MIALDTNILVYAHRADSAHHAAAAAALNDLAERGTRWAIPWPCVHEFLAVVTRPRLYQPPSTPEQALAAVRALGSLPTVTFMHEGPKHLEQLSALLEGAPQVLGPRIHDARIAAICLANGVHELWSADRDFSWFPQLRVVNPLVPGASGSLPHRAGPKRHLTRPS